MLTNDEKRIRFKNYFKKKDEAATTTSPSEPEASASAGGPIKRRRVRGPRQKPVVAAENSPEATSRSPR